MMKRPAPFSKPLLAAALVLASIAALPSTAAAIARPEQAKIVLNADRTAYEAGTTAHLSALVSIAPGWHVNSHTPTYDYLIPTVLELAAPQGWPKGEIRYPAHTKKRFTFAEQPLAVYDGDVVIAIDLKVPAGTAKGTFPVKASLQYQACNDTQCLPPVTSTASLVLTVGGGGKPLAGAIGTSNPVAPAPLSETPPARGLILMLLLGIGGGLILNAMPCVLPVLSLKVFGLMRSAGHDRSSVVRGALATAAGILCSFWALALAAIAAAAAGKAVGWGIQFQQPGFVALLAVVVVLFSLNLWGLFEVQLPVKLAQVGGAGPREGLAGHFVSGLFATLMATPCSAPFLGTAIGFALAQKAPTILAMFTAIGVGMALPYLLLAAAPGTAKLLPKPGAWMETLRGVMGFLLAASTIWLFYVLAAQVSPERLAALQLGLLGLALFTWLRWKAAPGRRTLRRVGLTGMAAAALATLVLAAAPGAAKAPLVAGKPTGLIPWTAFDRGRAETLAASGQLVFVDVTAEWCFTCKVNERLILETPEIAAAFKEHGVLPMKADWTNRSDSIAAFLAEHGRYGIPFYLLYRPGAPPHVFSELLTKDTIVTTLREAAAATPGAPAAPAS